MAAPILDAFGREATYQASSIYESAMDSGTRLQRPNLSADIATLLSKQKHRFLISDSRYISTSFPVVGGAVEQKSDYVCQAGFTPSFTGTDEDWGNIASAAVLEAHKIIDVRGGMFNWEKDWKTGCRMLDIDGDFFVLFGKSSTGYPQLQFLEAHRVGSRNGEMTVSSGTYEGLRIINGIIYNAWGREVAYRVLGSTAEKDADVSARDMMHVGDPHWFSDGRPFPSLAYAILDWYDAKEARGFQRTKQKVNSALTLTETTEDGRMPTDAAQEAYKRMAQGASVPSAAAPGSKSAPLISMLEGGLIRYIKAGTGDLKSHTDNTPGDGWLRFDQRIISGAFYGMGWRYEMMDPSALSGAPTRGFQDQINTAIYSRWLALLPFIARAELYTVACLIDRGDIPDHPEWVKWGYNPPADFTVDGGRSNAADLDNIRAGTDAHPFIIGRFGRTTKEVLRAQAKYLKEKEATEKEFNLPPGSLGTLSKPGMILIGDAAAAPQSTQPAQP